MSERFQVVIVGGGPVGVGLAISLAQRGVSCAVIERHTAVQRIPKGQNLTPRTLEHFYFWNCAEELRAARVMPKGYPIAGITAHGSLMSDYWYAPPQREVIRPYYFQDVERLPQYETERVLRARAARLPNITFRIGWTAETVEQDDAGVRVTIAETHGGARETLEAEYLVGCDGGHSRVRDQVGIVRQGTDFDQVMVLAVFRSPALHAALDRFPPRGTYNVLHPDFKGYWQFFGRIDVGEGFFFHAPVPADTTKENYDFLGLLRRAAGFDFDAEFDHLGFWDLRVAVADTYQVGRVLIAGDAAHSHPPYGGYGLNNGLEDATNLGWKLAATLEGWGGEGLLRSYSEERHSIFKETGEDFIAARIKADAEWLERYDPARDKAAFEAAWAARSDRVGAAVSSYEPNYEGSSIVAGSRGGKPSAHGMHGFAAKPGHHLAPQPLSSGKNVFEELGPGFTLLALGAADGVVRDFERASAATRVPLRVVRDGFDGGREQYGRRFVLVRPDQHVAWTGDEPPADAGALLHHVAGRTERSAAAPVTAH